MVTHAAGIKAAPHKMTQTTAGTTFLINDTHTHKKKQKTVWSKFKYRSNRNHFTSTGRRLSLCRKSCPACPHDMAALYEGAGISGLCFFRLFASIRLLPLDIVAVMAW